MLKKGLMLIGDAKYILYELKTKNFYRFDIMEKDGEFHLGVGSVLFSLYRIEWNRLSRLDDEEMRSLMLSIERALEMALCAYENLSDEDKKTALKFIMSQRTYDLPRT